MKNMQPKTLKLMLEETARQYGDKIALVYGDRRLSYGELDEGSNKIANALTGMGIEKGDRVAMLLPNSPEFVITYFGIVKIGAIAVPLNIKYKIDELTSMFSSSQPKVLVAENASHEPLRSALPRFKYIEHVIHVGTKYEEKILSYQQIMATSSASRIKLRPEPEDTALITYTSGPTTRPQGVVLSHNSLVIEAAISGYGFQQTDKDIAILFALPMHHVLGLVGVLLTAIYKGSTVVMVPGLSIDSVMGIIESKQATILIGVPYIYTLAVNMAVKEGIKHDLSSLRLCGSAGAPLSTDIIKRFKQHFGLDIIDFWGLSEAVCHLTCPPLNGSGKFGSVGKVLPGWEIKIVDDNGKELPTNLPGEIIVRGPIMKGYYNNPDDTARVIKDGWLYTGDIGKIDEDGYLFFVKIKKELILSKGQNIHPIDIETVLITHPKVAEAAVVGMPDEMRGEIVRVCISLKKGEAATEEEIRQFCRKHMANYMIPKQIVFFDSLPKTASGRIHKEALKTSPPESTHLAI
jgi:long-chain acyl-CoA synthetase